MQQQELKLLEERPVLTVSEIVGRVKSHLETSFRNVWVQGEISNFKVPPSGHFYFTLKDSEAQLRAVCFRMQNRYLRFRPEDGMDVLVRGSLSVYAPRGDFQLIAEYLEPVGRGALQLAFEQLKEKLSAEGLFQAERKKKLPLLPRKIGVVTSPTGAAVQDILRVLKRRNDRVDVLIFPVRVQGREAASEIVEGIEALNRRTDLDVIIVGRGGGSLEDLWAFNEEPVARAISASKIPIISAVGHEIDFTIADFVADLRAPTPSAAAEIVAGAREELASRVEQLERRAVQEMNLLLQRLRHQLHRLSTSRAFVDAESRLKYFLQRLDELYGRLLRTLPYTIEPQRQRVLQLHRELGRQIAFVLHDQSRKLETLQRQLQAYSPLAVLQRGYAIVSREDGRIVRDPTQVRRDDPLRIRVAGGGIEARVTDTDDSLDNGKERNGTEGL